MDLDLGISAPPTLQRWRFEKKMFSNRHVSTQIAPTVHSHPGIGGDLKKIYFQNAIFIPYL